MTPLTTANAQKRKLLNRRETRCWRWLRGRCDSPVKNVQLDLGIRIRFFDNFFHLLRLRENFQTSMNIRLNSIIKQPLRYSAHSTRSKCTIPSDSVLRRYHHHLMAHTHTRKLFNELYDSPAVTSAQLRPLGDSSSANHAYVAHLTQTQPHTQRQTKVKTQRTLLLNDSDESMHSTAAELVDVTDQAVDKHGNRQAILRTLNGSSGSDGKKTLYVDIYNLQSGHRTHSINVTTSHGLFCADPTFGRVRWSPCGRALVYTADRRKQSDGDDDAVSLFEKRRYVPSWWVVCVYVDLRLILW